MAWKRLLRTVQKRWTPMYLTDHEFLSNVYCLSEPARAGWTWLGVSSAQGRSGARTCCDRVLCLGRLLREHVAESFSISFTVGSRIGKDDFTFMVAWVSTVAFKVQRRSGSPKAQSPNFRFALHVMRCKSSMYQSLGLTQ